MRLDAFPTRVMLKAEYGGGLPLWDESPSPDMWFGRFPGGVLGLSPALETRLVQWNVRFDTLMGSTFSWPSAAENLAFVVDGHLLAADVQRELGADVLVLYLEADSERSRARGPERSGTEQTGTGQSGTEQTGTGIWVGAGAPGLVFSPAEPRRKTIVEQMWDMTDTDFAAMTSSVDVASLVWHEGQAPTRILLAPNDTDLPLEDRSAVFGRASGRVDPRTAGLSDPLLRRLRDWNQQWRDMSASPPGPEAGRPLAPRALEYLIDGHGVAAAVQREVGPEVAVLFPEADAARSEPDEEMREFIARLLGRGRGHAATV